MRYLIYLFWVIVLVLGVMFTSLNPQSVPLEYYFGKTNISLPVLLFVTLLVGALLGVVAMSFSVMSAKNEARKLRKSIKLLEKQPKSSR